MARAGQLSSSVVLAAVLAVVLAALGVDMATDPPAPVVPDTTEAPLLAGTTTCAALGLGPESTVSVSSVAVPDEDAEATAELVLARDGDRTDLAAPAIDGGALTTPVGETGDLAAVTARWEAAPLLLSRRWTVDDTQRVPGTVEGPCPGAPATQWYVPGITTAGGAAATLFLANPTDGPASLSVTFTTPDGPVAPTRLANLAVPAHDQVAVDLNQFVPEEPDLGIVVETRSGRVVAEALQTLEAAVGGVDGRSLVAAQPAPAETWTIPWLAASDEESAWVWVTNPSTEATDVRLVVHGPTGPVVPPDSGVTLPPGTTRRIDLRGALTELGSAAVTVRSAPGVPILAAGGVLRSVTDDPVRGGVAVVEALPAAGGAHAALAAVGATGHERFLALANPGEEDAVVDVSVVGRAVATTRVAAQGLVVPAGTSVQVPLDEDLPLEGGFAVLVDATEGVVAATLVSRATEGPLDLVAAAARAFPVSITVAEPEVVRDRGLLHPLAPTADDDLDAEGGTDAPVDTSEVQDPVVDDTQPDDEDGTGGS